jgi:hypothetical protein
LSREWSDVNRLLLEQEKHGDDRGAHPGQLFVLQRMGENLGAGKVDGAIQHLPAGQVPVLLAKLLDDLHREPASDFAAPMAAHAVGHDVEPQVVVLQEGILVVFPFHPDVGDREGV